MRMFFGKEFKEVSGFKGYYVSYDGDIVSTKIDAEGKLMCPAKHKKSGYWHLSLRGANGERINKAVHRIVAETLIPNPNNLPQVNHIDGNKDNNAVDNLEWCTFQENQRHAWENGLKQFPEWRKSEISLISHLGTNAVKRKVELVKVSDDSVIKLYESVNDTSRHLSPTPWLGFAYERIKQHSKNPNKGIIVFNNENCYLRYAK